jgi:hypothetical protein
MKTLLAIFKDSSINSFTDYISLGKKIEQEKIENQLDINKTINFAILPSSRSKWIIPYVFLTIIKYLQNETNATQALLLVHEDTPGVVDFFNRLGFKVIENAYPKTYLSRFFIEK